MLRLHFPGHPVLPRAPEIALPIFSCGARKVESTTSLNVMQISIMPEAELRQAFSLARRMGGLRSVRHDARQGCRDPSRLDCQCSRRGDIAGDESAMITRSGPVGPEVGPSHRNCPGPTVHRASGVAPTAPGRAHSGRRPVFTSPKRSGFNDLARIRTKYRQQCLGNALWITGIVFVSRGLS